MSTQSDEKRVHKQILSIEVPGCQMILTCEFATAVKEQMLYDETLVL